MIPVRGFEDKTVAVFGLGRTGLTAARALIAGGAKVALWDEKPASREAAAAEGFPVVDLQAADWRQFDALMLSPGVPLTHPKPHWTVEKAKAAGVEILGDVELFARTVNAAPVHKRPKIIAITGTNGKSTTTALIGHLCASAGRDTRIGGNIGLGVLGLEDMHGGAVYVLELSSYQLDLTSSLKPDAVVLLNISPDHLDRHGGMDGYIAAKRRIFLNQGKGDTAIIGVDDPWCQQICTEITAANRRTIWPISAGKAMGRGVYALQGVLYDATGERVVEVADLLRARSLPGRHNWQNAAAAYAAARAIGISVSDAVDGLMTFPGLAHRMETVGKLGKVRFVNDSKATNADAARQAMSSYPKFYWIAGGVAKAGGIEDLKDLFPRIAKAYLIGEAANVFAVTLAGKAEVKMSGTLDKAVQQAYADAAASGEDAIVLLSPACASFDQFSDFEARGEAFRAAVNALAGGAGKAAVA
ncbi:MULTISPECIES: UDP-N-acetylmuramoyl-L-alanine--D-glutamate ligase [Caulobacter]|jgi:UDP-N-acetylmuramoylalanine--D-glutamate ligase|uniref:UDP-N-acetylmuramoylalanine--D-glutamate ligase n=1 Tax=Caulobacter vibrioides OR37 TaxID=1292034 RepID=R0EL50_CAUVI|nr:MULTISPECIES: UDP-N-acetylmuramoyl-L-alanine--D-glutamate ligase [Caulobacter]ENZ82644.1 UDP-N-acetylmuramoylalanine--D-glutamate ligase [Caulobacter vibrioides OR37]MBQ1563650.1 UDP-N-acetylmuramoyl-L-alanine--D-glutamate ligase [Caulobacter sp.]